MNIHEYQAKEIFTTFGIPVPRSRVALTADQVERAAKEMGGHCVVKAQIYAGGRGKAGGVKVVHHAPRRATASSPPPRGAWTSRRWPTSRRRRSTS